MNSLAKQITGLAKLGDFLRDFCEKNTENYSEEEERFSAVLRRAETENAWFTRENLLFAVRAWADILTETDIRSWLQKYRPSVISKNVGLILAGNIPFVGFHDIICVILSNHIPMIKLSSKDQVIIPFLLKKWNFFSENNICYNIVDKLHNFDAVIATGSNNTARYLEYYFKDTLSIIRKNRTSVAVLSGRETDSQLQLLAEDIFRYFGLGCRNVTRLLLPVDFKVDRLFENFLQFGNIINHHKYANNYDYNKAVYLLNLEPFWDNNFVLLREDEALFSPISVLNFTRYQNIEEIQEFLSLNAENIQCVVADPQLGLNSVDFGQAQHPSLGTYADDVDTMRFLEVI